MANFETCHNCGKVLSLGAGYVTASRFSRNGIVWCSEKCMKESIKDEFFDEVIDDWVDDHSEYCEVEESDAYAKYGLSREDF